MNRFKNNNKKRITQTGFTLMEVLIVLAIITMLGSFVGVKVIDSFRNAKKDGAKIQIGQFQQALQAYYLAHSNYPHTSQGLDALVHKPTVGKVPQNYPDGGYMKNVPKDPWGTPYEYKCDDYQNPIITSAGPNQTPGDEDDIKGE